MPQQIYQIYYDSSHIPHLDKEFIPFDNSKAEFPLACEYGVMRRLYENGMHKKCDLLGTVSWRYFQKTKIASSRFLNFIRQNPGYDVYFINPYPELEFEFPSAWHQGQEHGHDEIIEVVQKVFDAIHYPINVTECRQTGVATYCNYWAGTAEFWEKYMAFTFPVYDFMVNHSTGNLRDQLLHTPQQHYEAAHNCKVPYLPFIMERLFSTLVSSDSTIRYKKFQYGLYDLTRRFPVKQAMSYYLKNSMMDLYFKIKEKRVV